MKSFAYLAAFCALLLAGQAGAVNYSNPVSTGSGADPSVLLHNGTYYFYATNDGSVYSSSDMVNWTKGSKVYPDGYSGIWAPDVQYNPADGKFYMHFTKDYYLHVAVSDAPDRKFTYVGQVFVNALDSHLFLDDDGSVYLYFVRIPGSKLYVAKMSSFSQISGPFGFIGEPTVAWEMNHANINEGPWMVKHDGTYNLMYSGSDAQSKYYAVGLAIADAPLGPFTKYEYNPVFQDLAGGVYGPGHGSVTRDQEGTLWHLYHQKADTSIGWNRYICIDPLYWDSEGILRGTPTRGGTHAGPVVDANLVWSPDIAPRGGSFDGSCTVTLSSITAGASIYYTTDGSDPDEGSDLYTGPFDITASGTVKAKAYKNGMTASTVMSQAYTVTGGSAVHAAPAVRAGVIRSAGNVYDLNGRCAGAEGLRNGIYFRIGADGRPAAFISTVQ